MVNEFNARLLEAIPFSSGSKEHKEYTQTVETLGALGIRSNEQLLKLLRNQQQALELRGNVISLLAWLHYQRAIPVFVEIARNEHEDISIRRSSLVYLPRLDRKRAFQAMKELATVNPSEEVRMMAVSLLDIVASKQMAQLVLQIIRDEKVSTIRAMAIRTIGFMPKHYPELTSGPLLTMLNNLEEVPDVRAYAAEALGMSGDRRALDDIVRFLADPAPGVRYMCAYSLSRLGDKTYLPLLQAMTTDDAEFETWGTVAEGAKEAIETIKMWDSEENEDVGE